ncbi:MAG TPA: acyltransferase [Oceanospirillales bacterium]|nr:acyltransferase [Oleispira sp.]HCM06623.1 acyltransferase [Oceanospirillales bacterium]|tara:strand:- start:275 stop:1195 length:921 start_codon:yes stop_codon:yes gene_type:complete
MRGKITAIIASSLLFINVIFWCSMLFIMTPIKFLLPEIAVRKIMDPIFSTIAGAWISCNSGWMKLTQPTCWDVELPSNLDPKGWYFVSSNHQTWVDIFVLQHVLNGKIPFLKFFLKQELIRVPIMGQAWWALDFPFMKRFSKSYLEKHPEMKGKDIETTQKACEKFKYIPTSVMNFFEGTRFTPEKHEKQNSPYKHLLLPKSGGFAFALNAMGTKFQSLLDCTIIYPNGIPSFVDFMQGKVPEITVRIREVPIPAEFCQGDYENDPEFKQRFQAWVSDLWSEKDKQIEALKKAHPESVISDHTSLV